MLKLLLGHWQAHREPLPFVLTDDPLYCSHLTKSPFPEVYSVNRVNPIFEDDETDLPTTLKRSISDESRRSSEDAGYSSGGHQKSVTNRVDPILEEEELPLKRSISCDSRYSPKKYLTSTRHWNTSHRKLGPEFYSEKRVHSNENVIPLQRSISENTRRPLKGSRFSEDAPYLSSDPLKSANYIFQEIENNPLPLKRSISNESRYSPRSSDDTGYSSSGHLKSAGSLTTTEDAASLRHMSSDSDDCSQPEAVVVSVDVHRVSNPEDVIILTSSALSSPSQTFSVSSSRCSDPYDSLTMSSNGDAKKPNLVVREKLQRLLEKGTDRTSNEAFHDSLEAKPPSPEDIEKTKNDLMKSLTRALNGKVPNKMESNGAEMVTRTDDSALDVSQKSLDRKSISSSTSPKALYFSQPSLSNGVTRQDESSASSGSISFVKHKRPRNAKHPAEKEAKRGSAESSQESSDSKKSQKCKLCENAKRPLAFHQLLPGHWSYDNVYLPHISGMCCSCVHHSPSFPPSSDDDVFYPMYFPHDMARVRHSWANPISRDFMTDKSPKRKRSTEDKTTSSNSKDKNSPRYSPDGSSRETSDSSTNSNQLKKSLVERRSLREPKKCKCEHCLASVLGKNRSHYGGHTCPCHSLSDRRVKFASDTDVSHHKHMHSIPINLGKEGSKLVNGEPINAAFVMNLPYLNGHALSNNQESKDNGLKSKKAPPLVPRGRKEPIKVDYRAYPVNFRDWEAHYRRSYLKKKRRRALNMVGMAIGIIMVVGIAVTLTFVFLRMRRPA